MTKASIRRRIWNLLDAIRADFPRHKRAAEAIMREMGMSNSLELKVLPPEPAKKLPTFGTRVYEFTPMLRARFQYASTIKYDPSTWLCVQDMAPWMKKREIKSSHRSLREHWEGSAPMIFEDNQLTLLEVVEGDPTSLVYLVWKEDREEPEIWRYSGMEASEFVNLEKYLRWHLDRE